MNMKCLKLDKKLNVILQKGYIFCLFLSLFATLMLSIYHSQYPSTTLFYIGFNLFRLSIVFLVEFIVCGIIVDHIFKAK